MTEDHGFITLGDRMRGLLSVVFGKVREEGSQYLVPSWLEPLCFPLILGWLIS